MEFCISEREKERETREERERERERKREREIETRSRGVLGIYVDALVSEKKLSEG